jgi:hypothetical protein
MIYGIIVTLLMLMAFGPKFIGSLNEEGIIYLLEVPKAFVNWYDNPTAFFFTYFIGYAMIWWRPLWGSVVIILGGILFFIFNSQNMGTFIFIIPTFLVALFYILYWIGARRKKINDA